MRIRHATIDDKPAIVRMALRFIQSTPYRVLLPDADDAGLQALVDTLLLLGDNVAILLAENEGGVFGMLCLVDCPHPATGDRYGDELVWWVDPGARNMRAGPRLLTAAEDWIRGRGAKMIKMVAPIPSDVGRFYERHGYFPTETAYVKLL